MDQRLCPPDEMRVEAGDCVTAIINDYMYVEGSNFEKLHFVVGDHFVVLSTNALYNDIECLELVHMSGKRVLISHRWIGGQDGMYNFWSIFKPMDQ